MSKKASEEYIKQKQELQQAYFIDKVIKGKEREIDRLKILSVAMGGAGGSREVQSSTVSSDKIGDVVSRIIELEEVHRIEMERLLQEKHIALDKIKQLPVGKPRAILEYRYVYLWNWYDIAAEIDRSRRQAMRLHDEAILKLIELGNKNNKIENMSHNVT